jgi:hypothetical protein
VQREWQDLAKTTARPPGFEQAMIATLPAPARRWLAHAIVPGTPLWQVVRLTMRGQIRLGQWRPFTATQVLAPPGGYIWAATARFAGLPVTGYDRLSSGTGEMRWRMLRLIPVMTAAGPDITRSAYGRLAGEIALIPTVFQHATWADSEQPGTAAATWRFGEDTETAELRVGDDGQLLQVMVNRWGNPGGEPFGRWPFGVSVEAKPASAGDHPLPVQGRMVVGYRPAGRRRVLPRPHHSRAVRVTDRLSRGRLGVPGSLCDPCPARAGRAPQGRARRGAGPRRSAAEPP